MSIPVVEIEHKTENIENGWCPQLPPSKCRECQEVNKRCIGVSPACLPDCPACAVEKAIKELAKYLVGKYNHITLVAAVDATRIAQHYTCIAIPVADWEQIKKLAEEETHG